MNIWPQACFLVVCYGVSPIAGDSFTAKSTLKLFCVSADYNIVRVEHKQAFKQFCKCCKVYCWWQERCTSFVQSTYFTWLIIHTFRLVTCLWVNCSTSLSLWRHYRQLRIPQAYNRSADEKSLLVSHYYFAKCVSLLWDVACVDTLVPSHLPDTAGVLNAVIEPFGSHILGYEIQQPFHYSKTSLKVTERLDFTNNRE